MNTKVYESADHVVRVKEENSELFVTVHRKDSEGREHVPIAYMLGYNSLLLKPSIPNRNKVRK